MERPPYLGDAGSSGWGVGSLSASVGRCDVGRAGAASGETGWSVVAGTGGGVKAVGIGPD